MIWSNSLRATFAVVVGSVFLLAGCSGESPQGAASSSDAAQPAPTATTATAKPQAIQPVPDATRSVRPREEGADPADAVTTNEIGVAVTLDEAASLACARSQFALMAIDSGEDPATEWAQAVEQAKSSKASAVTASIEKASAQAKPSRGDVVAVLTACAEGGYEL